MKRRLKTLPPSSARVDRDPRAKSLELSRRHFFQRLSSLVGAAAASSCTRAPPEKILPYVERPPEVVPGVPRYYATSTVRGAYAVGLLVESHVGRPTKIEGHPKHPASLGKTLAPEQAEILALYDPDRLRGIQHRGQLGSWHEFRALFEPSRGKDWGSPSTGKEVLLLEPTTSPLVASLLTQIERARPHTEIYFDAARAPVSRWEAAMHAFGEVVEPHYAFDKAERVLALDADFLAGLPMSIRWAHDFAKLRDPSSPRAPMSRLYVVEPVMSVTGATGDHRLAMASSRIGHLAAALLHVISRRAASLEPDPASLPNASAARRSWEGLSPHEQHWVAALGKDLARHRGRSAIIVGDRQPAAVHTLGLALNEALANVGKTVRYTASPVLRAGSEAFSRERFVSTLEEGQVNNAFVLGGNPAYYWPGEQSFARHLKRARNRVCLSLYDNETAEDATWLLGATHFLEAWGDCRAYDGTHSIRQPLIRPLHDGKSLEEVLAVLAGVLPSQGGLATVRRLLRKQVVGNAAAGADAEAVFANAVKEGMVCGSALPWKNVRVREHAVAEALSRVAATDEPGGWELEVLSDPRIDDGRLTNNPWLLELPHPITKLCWDNAAFVSPEDAESLGLQRGELLELSKGGRMLRAPALPNVGQASGTIGLWLGWGRKGSETNARGVGANAAALREGEQPWFTRGVQVRASGELYPLAITQKELSMHDRPLALAKAKHEWQKEPHFAKHLNEAPVSILPEPSREAPQWGMTVDLSRCTGCSACVIACQAENNIPTVGKEMVRMGREMHWIRIDTYHEGPKSEPKVRSQPMLCQHCEQAPCEYVCPVNATVHSDDGLNEMVYNRCVGTRFCSNNCPYKVRRFNYYEWNQSPPELRKMAANPDVTVRARGVMEKCTYCVQRIRRKQIDAKLESRALVDGEIQTACQQACPADAIVFGAISDPSSRVSRKYESQRTYAALNELGTQPRTRYLARIDNENGDLFR